MAKKKPTGFIAICQCSQIIGAMDYNRTENRDASKILGRWIADGCIIQPKFDSTWSCKVTHCKCD